MISNQYNSGCICFNNCNDWDDYTIKEKDTLYNISVKFGVPIRMLMSCNRLLNPYNLQVGQIIKVPSSRPEVLGCNGENERTYVIQLKDTLYTIAERMDSSVEEIMEKNPGLDPYNLKQGMRICVPVMRERSIMPETTVREDNNIIERRMEPESTAPMVMRQPSMAAPAEPTDNNDNMIFINHSDSERAADSTENNQHNMNTGSCDGRIYTVKSGDTLESILDAFDFTYAAMAFANPNVDLYALTAGTRLCIPMHDMFRGCNSGTTYIIRQGDSISSLSDRFNVSQGQLMAANPFMRSSDFATSGTRVCIPEN